MRGNIIKVEFKNRNIVIYTPPSYDKDKVDFPVVYTQDGDSLFNPENNRALDNLEIMFKKDGLKELVIVGVGSGNRLDEYTPWHSKALSSRFKDFGGKGKEYLSFIVNDLKPYIETNYSVDRTSENVGIIGYSLGGLISVYAAYLHPKVFGKIGALSPSMWYEGFIEFMKLREVNLVDNRIYMDVGSDEDKEKESIQKFMVDNVRAAYEIFLDKGVATNNLKLYIEEGSKHGQEAFIRRFPYMLQWLFS